MRNKITNIYLRDPSKNKHLKKPVIVIQFHSGRQKGITLNCDMDTARQILQRMRNELELGIFDLTKYIKKRRERITLLDFMDKWLTLREKQVEIGHLSYKTFLADKDTFKIFKEFLGNKYPIAEIDRKTIDEFVQYALNKPTRQGTPRSRTSINIYLRHLSSAFSWAQEIGYIETNPFLTYPKLKNEQRPIRYITEKEEEKLRKILAHKPAWQQDVFELALLCGLRAGEFIHLKKEDLIIETINEKPEYFLRVFGKGNKTRMVPLPQKALEIIQKRIQWIESEDKIIQVIRASHKFAAKHRIQRHLTRARQGYLFFEVSKTDSISQAFRRVFQEAGIQGKNIHSVRHAFGTRCADAGIPIEVIQAIMGHSDVRTTQIYSKVTLKNMSESIKRYEKYSEEYRKAFSE